MRFFQLIVLNFEIGILDVPWLRWLGDGALPQRPEFSPRPVHVVFLEDKFTLGLGFLQALKYFLVIIIPVMFYTHI